MSTKAFPTLDVLAAVTGIGLNRDDIMGFHGVMDHALGDTLMTHQLPAAFEPAREIILRQHPGLAQYQPPEDRGQLQAWIDRALEALGPTLDIESGESPDWVRHNALADLVTMVGPERVIPMVTSDGE